MKIGKIIAERVLIAAKGRRQFKVSVKIGQPVRAKRLNAFACPIQIKGVGDGGIRFAAGEDSMQALQLALKMVSIELFLRYSDYEFSWLDQPDAGFIRPD